VHITVMSGPSSGTSTPHLPTTPCLDVEDQQATAAEIAALHSRLAASEAREQLVRQQNQSLTRQLDVAQYEVAQLHSTVQYAEQESAVLQAALAADQLRTAQLKSQLEACRQTGAHGNKTARVRSHALKEDAPRSRHDSFALLRVLGCAIKFGFARTRAAYC